MRNYLLGGGTEALYSVAILLCLHGFSVLVGGAGLLCSETLPVPFMPLEAVGH